MKTLEHFGRSLSKIEAYVTDAQAFLKNQNLTMVNARIDQISEEATNLYNDFQQFLDDKPGS